MIIKQGVYGFTHVRLHCATSEWTLILMEVGVDPRVAAITSNQDGKHSRRSDHWDGRALDYRTWIIEPDRRQEAADLLKERLKPSKDWFIQLESDHLHVSYRGRTEVI